jgi:hypothetical protein
MTRKLVNQIFQFSVGYLLWQCLFLPCWASSGSEEPTLATFSPPSGEYQVLMPPQPKLGSITQSGVTANMYTGSAAGHNYVIVTSNLGKNPDYFAQCVQGILAEAKKHGMTPSGVTDVSGIGWTGKKIGFSKAGTDLGVQLAAYTKDAGIVYLLSVNAPMNSDMTDTFLKSFVVFPDKAIAAHKSETPLCSINSPAYNLGYSFGYFVGFIVLPAIIIAIIWRALKGKMKADNPDRPA